MNNLNTINLCLDQNSLRDNSEIDPSLNTKPPLFKLPVKTIQEIGKFCNFHSLNSLYTLYERKVDHINVTNMLKKLILAMIGKSRISYTFSAIEDNQSLDDFEKRKWNYITGVQLERLINYYLDHKSDDAKNNLNVVQEIINELSFLSIDEIENNSTVSSSFYYINCVFHLIVSCLNGLQPIESITLALSGTEHLENLGIPSPQHGGDVLLALAIEMLKNQISGNVQGNGYLYILAKDAVTALKANYAAVLYLKMIPNPNEKDKKLSSISISSIPCSYFTSILYSNVLDNYKQNLTDRKKLALLSAKRGDYRAIKFHFSYVSNQAERMYKIAEALMEDKNYTGATRYYEKVIATYKKECQVPAVLFNNLACAYFELKQYKKAAVNYEKAIAVYNLESQIPLTVNILANLAYAYYQLGQYELAIKYYLKLIDIVDIDQIPADVLANLASAYLQQAQYILAIKYYLKYIDNSGIDQVPAYILFYLTVSYFKLGQYTEAEKCALKALEKAYSESDRDENLINQIKILLGTRDVQVAILGN